MFEEYAAQFDEYTAIFDDPSATLDARPWTFDRAYDDAAVVVEDDVQESERSAAPLTMILEDGNERLLVVTLLNPPTIVETLLADRLLPLMAFPSMRPSTDN